MNDFIPDGYRVLCAQDISHLLARGHHCSAQAQAGALTLARDLLLQPQRFPDIATLVEAMPRYERAGLDPDATRSR